MAATASKYINKFKRALNYLVGEEDGYANPAKAHRQTIEEVMVDAIRKSEHVYGSHLDVPTFYTVYVSPTDYEEYYRARGAAAMAPYLAEVLATYVEGRNSALSEQPRFVFLADESLADGETRIDARYSSGGSEGFNPTPVMRDEPDAAAADVELDATPSVTPAHCSTKAAIEGPLIGGDRQRIYDGATIGAVWNTSRPTVPDLKIDKNRSPANLSAHQMHGMFHWVDNSWFFEGLGEHLTTVETPDGQFLKLGKQETAKLDPGARLRFSGSAVYTFCEE